MFNTNFKGSTELVLQRFDCIITVGWLLNMRSLYGKCDVIPVVLNFLSIPEHP